MDISISIGLFAQRLSLWIGYRPSWDVLYLAWVSLITASKEAETASETKWKVHESRSFPDIPPTALTVSSPTTPYRKLTLRSLQGILKTTLTIPKIILKNHLPHSSKRVVRTIYFFSEDWSWLYRIPVNYLYLRNPSMHMKSKYNVGLCSKNLIEKNWAQIFRNRNQLRKNHSWRRAIGQEFRFPKFFPLHKICYQCQHYEFDNLELQELDISK